jgi:hypothetical protein
MKEGMHEWTTDGMMRRAINRTTTEENGHYHFTYASSNHPRVFDFY